MPKNLKLGFILAILFSFLLSCWWVLHGDLTFSSDIARDFLLFSEIDQKHIVLIGPKSSVAGLFHGPLWLYVNYPAYLIGHGNPVVVASFWIVLIILFTGACFYIGKKLFGEFTGYLFASMVALYMFFHSGEFFNPLGAMFLIPVNFYLLVKYLEKYNIKYLICYILLLGCIVQFELAIGIPLFILSVILLFILTIRAKKPLHLLTFSLILIPLANFLAFDIRHQFILTHGVLRYISPASGDSVKYNPFFMIFDRFKLLTINVEILRFDPYYRNALTGAIFIFLLISQIKNNKFRKTYLLFLYFYVGYFVTTFINRGPILYFYFFPFFPFVYLIFSSFITSKYKYIFLFIFAVIYFMNLQSAFNDIYDSRTKIGIEQTSWKFLDTMASRVYEGSEKEFGYFVYTPDTIAYGPKYALRYEETKHPEKNGAYFTKKRITYIIVAPPAPNNPYLSYTWWRNVRVKIDKNPTSVVIFPNGYKIEKYVLTDTETKIPYDHGIDPGLNFR